MAQEALNQPMDKGFEGALSGMTLADLIQIKNINRFSGCLSVEHGSQKGVVFFRDGELVHAELDDKTGREAFFDIIHWPNGEFRADPKIVTTCRTINESLTYLLLEAHRLKDEMSNIQTTEEPPKTVQEPAVRKGEKSMSDINNKLRVIPEVEYAVVLTKEGVPVDDATYEGATYAASGLYLSMFATQLGALMGAGDLVSAAVQGTSHHMLLFQSKTHFLNITLAGSSQLGAVETSVRAALAQK
jgi:predicted regulator of Ras-like GTPase activity (Roadblock/LC7/MglB family)